MKGLNHNKETKKKKKGTGKVRVLATGVPQENTEKAPEKGAKS